MTLDELKNLIANKLIDNVDWESIADTVADNLGDDLNSEIASKIQDDVDLDELADKVVEQL